MEGSRGSEALAAARAAARARREEAKALAEQARIEQFSPAPEPEPDPEPEPEPLPVFVELPPRREVEEGPETPTADHLFGQGVTSALRSAREPRPERTGIPGWYPPLVGVWAAAFVAVTTLDDSAVRLVGAGVLALLVVVFFTAYRAPDRTAPSLATASAYAVAVVMIAVAAWFVAREFDPAAGAALAGALMTGLVAAYER